MGERSCTCGHWPALSRYCSDLTFLIHSNHDSRRDNSPTHSATERGGRTPAERDGNVATNAGPITADARRTAEGSKTNCRARKAEDAKSEFREGQQEKASSGRKEAAQATGCPTQSCPPQIGPNADRGASTRAVSRLSPAIGRDQPVARARR